MSEEAMITPTWSICPWPPSGRSCPVCHAPCVLSDGIILYCSEVFEHPTAVPPTPKDFTSLRGRVGE